MRFLDLLQPMLARHGHACCRVDGSQGAEERDTQARRGSTVAPPRGGVLWPHLGAAYQGTVATPGGSAMARTALAVAATRGGARREECERAPYGP